MLSLTDSDIKELFEKFEINRDGSVDCWEFICILHRPMNNFSNRLVM
jgi:Ca2+-binding EF-hand superfamily protein